MTVDAMDVGLKKLINILCSNNKYWRNESVKQICDVVRSDTAACGAILDAIRRGVIEFEGSSWDARISAGDCIRQITALVLSGYDLGNDCSTMVPESQRPCTLINFDLSNIIQSGTVLGAGKLINDVSHLSNEVPGYATESAARLQLERHLELNPIWGISSEHIVSDAELLGQSAESNCKHENQVPIPTKCPKLEIEAELHEIMSPPRTDWEKLISCNAADSSAADSCNVLRLFQRLMVDDLSRAVWTVRHGAAEALKSLLRGGVFGWKNTDHRQYLSIQMSAVLMCIARDFFNDFVDGHVVVAPVRETCAQVVALMLAHCHSVGDEEIIMEALNAVRSFLTPSVENSLIRYRWKYIHSGLLLAKYILPTMCNQTLSARLRGTLVDLLEDVCLCMEHQNEDLIQVCCDSFECCLPDIRGWCPVLSDRLVDVVWSRLVGGHYDPVLDDWSVALLCTTSKLTTQCSATHRPLDPVKLPVLCSFMHRTVSSQAFQAATKILMNSVETFGVKEWPENAVLRVMRCLFLRRLVVDPDNNAENRLTGTLWSQMLKQSPVELVLRPLAPFFNQWLCSSIVADNYPALNLCPPIIDDLPNAQDEQPVFLAGLDGSVGDPSRADLLAKAKMDVAQFLATFAFELYANKIPAWWTPNNAENWLQDCLLIHSNSDSATQRSFLYMVLLQWLKLKPTEMQFPFSTLRDTITVDHPSAANRPMSVEILPLLTEFNKIKQTIKQQILTSAKQLDRSTIELIDETVIDFEQAELFLDRWSSGQISLQHNAAAVISNSSALMKHLENFQRTAVDLVQKMRQFESRTSAWLACCQIADHGRPLPNRINSLIAALMRIIKKDGSAADPLSVETGKAVHMLVRRLVDENRSNAADKLIKNLVLLNSVKHLDTVKKLSENNGEQQAMILDWEQRISAFTRRIFSTDSSLSNPLKPNCNIAGSVLRMICAACGENLAAIYPTLFNLLDRACEPSASNQQAVVGLNLLQCVLPALHNIVATQIMGLNEPYLFVHLACQSPTVRHVTSLLIACLASHMEQFFINKIMCRLVDNMTSETSPIFLQLGCAESIMNILGDAPPPAGFLHLVTLPLLARMNHHNECLRCVSATCLSTMVRLLPLQTTFDPLSSCITLEDPKVRSRIRESEELMALLSRPSSILKQTGRLKYEPSCGLRAYQKEGVAWLMFLHRYGLSGLLGDDMGLGKTVQTLCCIANCYPSESSDVSYPSLIVCPKTLVGHWLQETETFFNPQNVQAVNLDTVQQLNYFRENCTPAGVCVLYVTSYEFLRRQVEFFCSQQWFYCVLDEGHVIRNEKTATSQAVLQLKSQHRIVLSGTPVQNNVLELWALFEFLLPGYLGEKKRFNKLYGKVTAASARENTDEKSDEANARALDAVHRLVLPFILRRRKADVLADLPPKIVQSVLCELSPLQSHLYRDFVQQLARHRSEPKTSGGQGSALQVLTYLRKLCDHPCLVLDNSDTDVVNKIKSEYDVKQIDDYKLSSKMVALKELLIECGISENGENAGESTPTVSESHRALIFCQFTSVITLISRYLESKVFGSRISYLTMDGSTSVEKRQKIVTSFNTDPTVDVLLLTTAVGGLGLNLTGADVVIFVDHDWNPCKDLQAMDRVHRLGQRRTVNVYRLICKDSLEEKIIRYQQVKTDASNTVISDQNSSLKSMATDQLFDLLQDSLNVNNGKKNVSSMQDTLTDLWDQSQYEVSFDLKSFLSQMNNNCADDIAS